MRVKTKDNRIVYDCDCSFEIAEKGPPMRLKVDIENIPETCERTWNLIGEGNTKGVFQLETRFGQQYAEALKPENIDQIAALSAILRPGALNNIMEDGKSVTDHYIMRKNRQEPVEYFHPELESILGSTFGLMCYQEQAMQIAQKFAGFDLQQADVLRKAIGKKKADVMAKVKKQFLEGCEAGEILTIEQAEELFGWIEKSQRYSFNKSHAVAYSHITYLTAYLKAHFPVSFFTSYLYFAKDKQKPLDEIRLLINNANLMDISVLPPDFRRDNKYFQRSGNSKDIFFGLCNIKKFGDSAFEKMKTAVYQAETILEKPRSEWNWLEFLIFFSQDFKSKAAVEGMIEVGACDCWWSDNLNRTRMLFEFEQYSKLTKIERLWITQNLHYQISNDIITTIEGVLEAGLAPYYRGEKGMCANKNRVKIVEGIVSAMKDTAYSMQDTCDWIANVEEARLGVPLTASAIDSYKSASQANCTVLDFIKHKDRNEGLFIACHIDEIKPYTMDNSDEMAFIKVSDGNMSMDCVIFSDNWEKIQPSGMCFENNNVLMSGERSRKGSFLVRKMWQLS